MTEASLGNFEDQVKLREGPRKGRQVKEGFSSTTIYWLTFTSTLVTPKPVF